jgi:tetratricopeptide (TPR) repeat protein
MQAAGNAINLNRQRLLGAAAELPVYSETKRKKWQGQSSGSVPGVAFLAERTANGYNFLWRIIQPNSAWQFTMRLSWRKSWIALLVLAVGAVAVYKGGFHVWGVYHYRAAQQALAQRDFAQASVHLEKCVALWPSDAPVRLLAAQTARRDGDLGEARKHLRIYRQKQGSAETTALEQQLLQIQMGDMRDAVALLESCFARPEAAETALVLETVIEGSLRAQQPALVAMLARRAGGERAGPPSVEQLRRAVDLWLARYGSDADQVVGLVWRGRLHAYMSEYAPAVADFRSALARHPDDFHAHWYLAALIVREDPQEAAAHLEALYQRHPANPRVCLFLAGVRRTLGRLDEARPMLDEILQKDPNDVSALLERGKLSVDAQQFADAETWLRRAEKLAPEFPELNLELSRCLQMAGRLEEAAPYRARFEKHLAEKDRMRDELNTKAKSAHKS